MLISNRRLKNVLELSDRRDNTNLEITKEQSNRKYNIHVISQSIIYALPSFLIFRDHYARDLSL